MRSQKEKKTIGKSGTTLWSLVVRRDGSNLKVRVGLMSPQSEESIGEENNRDKRDTDESIEEEEKGVEDNIGNCVTDEEEDGAVTCSSCPMG